MSAGAIIGLLIRSAICGCESPSMRAASYSSDGTARSAVYMTIMLNPVPPHTPTLATDSSATCVVNRLGIDSPHLLRISGNGDTVGRYRNPQSSEAMTVGTAY